MEQIERKKFRKMLYLLVLMINNKRLTLDDLAEKIQVQRRTVYRYIDEFEDSGLTVEGIGHGVHSITKIDKKFFEFSKLLMLTEDEAFLFKSFVSSLEESHVMKQDLLEKLAIVCDDDRTFDFGVYKNHSKQTMALRNAIDNGCRVVLRNYESGHTRTRKDRLVEPFQFAPDLEYVHAYEVETGENKVFLVSRIGEVQLLPDKWENERFFLAEEADAFGMMGEELIPVRLELDLLAKNILIEEYPLAEKDLHLTSTGKWILSTEVRSMNGIGRFAAGLLDRINIVKSPELVEYLLEFEKNYRKLVG